MVDHFSDLTYVHLTRSKNQEETLAVKLASEIWSSTFGVKIQTVVDFMNKLSDNKLRNPTRKYYFLGLYHIIKIPFLKERLKLLHYELEH